MMNNVLHNEFFPFEFLIIEDKMQARIDMRLYLCEGNEPIPLTKLEKDIAGICERLHKILEIAIREIIEHEGKFESFSPQKLNF